MGSMLSYIAPWIRHGNQSSTIDLWSKPDRVLFRCTDIRFPRTLPCYFRGHSFHFRGRSRTTIHFRNASENISIVEVRNVAKNAFRCPRRFREPWFADPFREVILLYKPKIKRIHGGFGRCSIVDYLNIFEYERAGHSTARLDIMSGWWYTYPSEKYDFVSWDDDIPKIWKVINFKFQTTNQMLMTIQF